MNTSLAVLIVEDSESDAQFIVRLLNKAGYEVISEQVETAEQMYSALEKRIWDVVISDYSLPRFNGSAALDLLMKKQLDTPFIVVSGVIGEENAVAMMKAGAHDYLRKDNLARLIPAVKRELEQAEIRRERKQAEQSLRESEEKYRLSELDLKEAQAIAHIGNWKWNLKTGEVIWSDEMYRIFGIDKKSYVGRLVDEIAKVIHPDDLHIVLPSNAQAFVEKKPVEYRIILPDKSIRTIWAKSGEAVLDEEGNVIFLTGVAQDITERKQADEAIRESEERLAAVIEGSQLGYSDWYIQTGRILRNERWAGMLGYTLKEIENTYRQWEDLVHPDDRAAALQAIQDHLDRKTPIHRDEYRLRAKDGSYRWVLDQGKIIEYDPQGRPLRMTATHTDVTEYKQAEDQIRQLSRAVEHSPASIMITDINAFIEYVNPKFTALNGYTLDEVRGKTPRILKSNKTPPEIYPELWQTILSGKEWRGEFLNRKKNGELYWEYASISGITDLRGNITHFVSVNEDITARKEAEDKIKRLNAGLEQLAMTDYLTNLYNRRYFMQRGVEEFKRARRNNQPLGLLMLDIDQFKKVNDTYGHDTGDMALQQVAATLKSSLREIDILGRIGGEEFAVLLPNTSLHDAVLLAERVQQVMAGTPIETLRSPLFITISIGVAIATDEISRIDDLLRTADTFMYQAKSDGGNRVVSLKYISGGGSTHPLQGGQ